MIASQFPILNMTNDVHGYALMHKNTGNIYLCLTCMYSYCKFCSETEQTLLDVWLTHDMNPMERRDGKNNEFHDYINQTMHITHLCCDQQLLLHRTFPG